MPDLSNGGALPTLRQQISTLSQQEADLLARYGPSHPLVVNVKAQQRDVERAIGAEAQRLAAGIKNDYELALSRVASFDRSLREATGQSSIDDTTAIRLRELDRTAAVNKSLFEDFLQRAKITQEQSTFEAREARIITPAQPPGAPSYPRKRQFLAINLLIGLLLGVGGAVAKELLNAGFTTPKRSRTCSGCQCWPRSPAWTRATSSSTARPSRSRSIRRRGRCRATARRPARCAAPCR
jgi:uncharacterized protein involved in exopolysaccharide biosynthesis